MPGPVGHGKRDLSLTDAPPSRKKQILKHLPRREARALAEVFKGEGGSTGGNGNIKVPWGLEQLGGGRGGGRRGGPKVSERQLQENPI